MTEQITITPNPIMDNTVAFDYDSIPDYVKTLKKKESNLKYYLKYGEKHRQKMKDYYDENVKDRRYYCNCCHCHVLSVNKNHKYCKKHIENLEQMENIANVNPEVHA